MSTWHWPQIVIGIYLLLDMAGAIVRVTKTGTSGEKFAGMMLVVILTTFIAWVLSKGGFW